LKNFYLLPETIELFSLVEYVTEVGVEEAKANLVCRILSIYLLDPNFESGQADMLGFENYPT